MVFWVVLGLAVLNVGLGFAAAVWLGRRHQRGVAPATDGAAGDPIAAERGPPAPPPPAPPATAESLPGSQQGTEPSSPSADHVAEAPVGEAPGPEPLADQPAGQQQTADQAPASAVAASVQQGPGLAETAAPQAALSEQQLATSGLFGGAVTVDSYTPARPDLKPEYLDPIAYGPQQVEVIEIQPRESGGMAQAAEAQSETASDQALSRAQDAESAAEPAEAAQNPKEVLVPAVEVLEPVAQRPAVLGTAMREPPAAGSPPPSRALSEQQLSGIFKRFGLESEMARLRDRQTSPIRQLTVAMLDLDQFAEVNRRYGKEVGNRILRAVERLIAVEGRDQWGVGRLSGQRFVLLLPDVDIRYAASLLEHVRQTLEVCRFQYQEFEIRVTASCGVTAADSSDTPEGLFARLENTLLEAKRYGGNRTFLHEGRYPSPVVPPNFTLKERAVTL